MGTKTIAKFCEDNSISRSTYYNLDKIGKGPRVIRLGQKIIITDQAEADWQREREAEPVATMKPKTAAAA
jgi:hypothetical protein